MHVPDTIEDITADGFTTTVDGKPREIRYDDITGIETTDQGTWLPDCSRHSARQARTISASLKKVDETFPKESSKNDAALQAAFDLGKRILAGSLQ